MARALNPIYDPEDPRGESWRTTPAGPGPMQEAFYRAHYRHGERGLLNRYIIRPRRGALNCGWTVGDTAVALCALALAAWFAAMLVLAFAPLPPYPVVPAGMVQGLAG